MLNDKSIDIQFLNRLGIKLAQFKRKDNDLWNCRCPLCGDSRNNKAKARGYFGFKKTKLWFYCHNCLKTRSFGSLLKQIDPAMYQEYVFAKFRTINTEKEPEYEPPIEKPIFPERILDEFAVPVANLQSTHVAKRFVAGRKLPESLVQSLYFTEDCKATYEGITGEKESEFPADARIIIPFYDENKKLIGFQGRAIDPKCKLRYVTAKLTGDRMIWGLDKVDWTKDIYMMEGPFDASFIQNSLAASSSALLKLDFDSNTIVHHVFDNQPRNKEINLLMQECISQNKSICIWPNTFRFKDINKAIECGMTPEEVQGLINKSLYQGLQARVRYSQWQKVN